MLEECTDKPHNYTAVHAGLVGGQTLVQCKNCKIIGVMWSAVLQKEQQKYKAYLNSVAKRGGFVENVKRLFGGK